MNDDDDMAARFSRLIEALGDLEDDDDFPKRMALLVKAVAATIWPHADTERARESALALMLQQIREIWSELDAIEQKSEPCHGPQDMWCPACGLGATKQ